jgi:hypothetical protein
MRASLRTLCEIATMLAVLGAATGAVPSGLTGAALAGAAATRTPAALYSPIPLAEQEIPLQTFAATADELRAPSAGPETDRFRRGRDTGGPRPMATSASFADMQRGAIL